jgi:hypothetical protein
MLIFCPQESARFTYILNELLVRRMGITYTITDNESYFLKSSALKLNYSLNVYPNCVNIPMCSLLFEQTVAAQDIQVHAHNKWLHVFFELDVEVPVSLHEKYTLLPFDLFAASFYLLSRYEELLPKRSTDLHGRFEAKNSLAVQNEFIHLPLIDCWMEELKLQILEHFPTIQFKQHQIKFINTIDIDFVYQFKALTLYNKLKKSIGFVFRNQLSQVKNVWFPLDPDPYDTYSQLMLSHVETLFFVLMANGTKHDKNIHLNSQEFHNLLKRLNQSFQLGVHPSIQSHRFPKQTQKEIEHLSTIIQKQIQISRQHFLKFKWPDTFRKLSEAGIKEDYSMAYPDVLGFRAATAFPFKAFDCKNNCELNILIHSPCVMDVTLKNQLKHTPDEAIDEVKKLQHNVAKVGGEFIGIWHNSSFDEYQGWRNWERVYHALYSK